VRTLGAETLIYDLDRHVAHCLNPVAAAVLAACDGRHDTAAIARVVERDVPGASPELVELALARLARARLVEDVPVGLPRRDVLRRLAQGAALLPLVSSIVAPEAAQAASCAPVGGCCNKKADCCPGLNCVGPRLPQCPPALDKSCR
jgi:hypothetical protein